MNEQPNTSEVSPEGSLPILYVRPSCPESEAAVGFFEKHSIGVHKKDVSRDPIALLELQHKSRQAAAPVLDWNGRLLAKFGLDQLKTFLQQQNVAFVETPEQATA